MKVLVTGGAGAVGTAVIRGLSAHGHTVRVLDVAEANNGADESVVGTVADMAAVAAAVAGMHCRQSCQKPPIERLES